MESQAEVADNQWSPDVIAAEVSSLPSLPEVEDTTTPIDAEDELHPMYRVVSAMLDVDSTAEVQDESVPVEAQPTGTPSEPAPTATLADALREEGTASDADFPPLPTRIDELTQAIERYPQSPVNYVLRGEAHWDEGHGREAAKDFLAALKLAESRDTTWEFLNRSFLDRARQGLRRCGYEINDFG